MDRFDPFVKYADVYGDIINWEKDPMNKPQNQNKYFFSDGKTYYEQICKMLRLMSVFKEAFNQIYSNEDEISEAWENFVNNLSASVVEGSEPDVTLTWTDDSVNFEFTMVPGVPGEQGVGITSISFNSDYTMTITLSDGNSYTSMSLKGENGPQGPQGETGSGLQILDVYATLADLQSAHPTGQPGDAYQVGSAGNYTLYIWSSSQSAWVQAGTLGTVSPYTSTPLMDGTASAGSQNLYARGDHVHPSDTSRASKEELDALIRTSQSLIDQSFTYRESPSIQDGLARIDKIKGNTLVWNQLYPNPTTFSNSASFGFNNGQTFYQNHKYLFNLKGNLIDTSANNIALWFYGRSNNVNIFTNRILVGFTSAIWTCTATATSNGTVSTSAENNVWIYFANRSNANITSLNVIDLTQMFGAGNEPTTVDEFTALFPLPYYAYESGSLLSFNGTELKTKGKNQLKLPTSATLNGITFTVGTDGQIQITGTATAQTDFYLCGTAGIYNDLDILSSTYTFSCHKDSTTTGLNFFLVSLQAGTRIGVQLDSTSLSQTVTLDGSDKYRVFMRVANGTTINTKVALQLEFGSTATDFEPYTESTIDLPIATYFPTGMKSAGSVYDELTPTKAVTRIGAVDLGTLNYVNSGEMFYAKVSGMAISAQAKCIKYDYAGSFGNVSQAQNGTTNGQFGTSAVANYIFIHDSTFSDANSFKAAMNGVYLYYELAAPTETTVDLDLDFMAYENGTEQLLPVNGSVPVTSPIRADMTYLSIDDAMEYIIDKLANVPQNTQQILESLEDDVADLQTDVGALQPAVSALQTSVGNINTNIGQISSTVAGHTASISDMQSDISDLNTGLSDLEDTVTDNTARIRTLESGLSTTNGNVQNLSTSVSGLDSTVTAQGTTVTELDSIIQDISNNPVGGSIGNHELGFVLASVEATLPANTGTMVTIPKPSIFPNNYTPLFIVGMSTGSNNVSICSIPYTFGNSNSVTCRVWNHGSQQTTQISVYILCMRQRQSQ